MRKLVLLCAMLSAMAVVVPLTPAQAIGNTRSWVSGVGADANPCSRTAPCQTFAGAILKTAAGGEIDCLDPSDFGPVAIAQSVTIDCGAGQAGGIGVTSGTAVIISASSNAVITLRNLNLNGLQGNAVGISTSGFSNGTLILQNCSVHGFTTSGGIDFTPSSGRGLLQISDTAIYNNSYGIVVSPASGVIASAVLNRVEITGNINGLLLEGGGTVAGTLRQSVVAENSSYGVYANAAAGVYFTVEESSVVDNLSAGIISPGASTNLEVGASTIGGNGTGVSVGSGAIYTFGNNQISANGANGSFTPGGPGLQ